MQFGGELAILGDTLQHMSEAAAQQRAVLEDEYKHWHTYQQQASGPTAALRASRPG